MIITSSPKNKILLGENNKSLNKRLLSGYNLNNATLLIDLSYYSLLVSNKIKFNNLFKAKWDNLIQCKVIYPTNRLEIIDLIFEPIINVKRLVDINSIILLTTPYKLLTGVEKELYKLLSGIIDFIICTDRAHITSNVYSLAINEKQKYIIITDDINFWSICSKKSNIFHCMISKNNRPKFYFDKFGLEYLSSLIQTNKLVNKLRLSKLKYVNLQYLYILLLYVKFKKVKADQTLNISDKSFLGSKGQGLSLLSDAHKEISYIFLTKSDLIDIFLTSSTTHFILNLSRLLKIVPMDITLMGAFSGYYNNSNPVRQIGVNKKRVGTLYYKVTEKSKAKYIKPFEIQKTKPSLPTNTTLVDIDIAGLDTSMAVDLILKDLAW